MIYNDPSSLALLSRVEMLANSNVDVLIHGETGTGKELIAERIHRHSARRGGPSLSLNCGALPDALIESELFGHEKGAFTGASEARAGWFEAAHGGTLFLDEIGELPLSTQVKLLRVLQARSVTRIGARKPVPIDVRIIAATHVDLLDATAQGRFRQDLYYRLRVGTIDILPLRMRPGDILPLARHFAARYGRDTRVPLFTAAAEAALFAHPWPGNARELENVIRQALVFNDHGAPIAKSDLDLSVPTALSRTSSAVQLPSPVQALIGKSRDWAHHRETLQSLLQETFATGVPDLYEALDRTIIAEAYQWAGENQQYTADVLGISRSMLRTKLQRHGLLEGGYRVQRRRNVSDDNGR